MLLIDAAHHLNSEIKKLVLPPLLVGLMETGTEGPFGKNKTKKKG